MQCTNHIGNFSQFHSQPSEEIAINKNSVQNNPYSFIKKENTKHIIDTSGVHKKVNTELATELSTIQ